MMKLKYLFDNRDLATMLIENWKYDIENISYMDRISSNAVYPFSINGKAHFLRFSPIEEKSESDLLAELHFIEYLSNYGYSVNTIVQTKTQSNFINTETPWGNYLAVVFKGVEGKQIETLPYSDEMYFGYGKSLGELHKLSQSYKPVQVSRSDWKQRLYWTKKTLLKYSAPDHSIIEVDILLDFLSSIHADKNNYGLIHYDFDDSVYHWFAMDIEQSINSIKSEIPAEYHKKATENFLSGYQSKMYLSEDIKRLLPFFRRYAVVFGYARCLRSLHETWNNDPEWMTGLRKKIHRLMISRQEKFGHKIEL